jgi:trans-aconitate methyltransferase
MTEWRLTDEVVPHVSTLDYHRDRERAPHLEQEWHRPRLERAAEFVRYVAWKWPKDTHMPTVSDLGCGDGGLLSLIKDDTNIIASWGYDFQPSNAAGWAERGVNASALDVFGADWRRVQPGSIVVMTEVLEHIAEPHSVLTRLSLNQVTRYVVCSSPRNEHPGNHSDCHAWAWDMDGYRAMVEGAGWRVLEHEPVGLFQVILAELR